jgi:hypothetical protein
VASHLIQGSLRQREEAQLRARRDELALLRSTQRPSISRILEIKEEAAPHQPPGQSGAAPHRFRDFCHQLRFSGNTSARLKAACYYVVALPPATASPEAKHDALRLLLGSDRGTTNTAALHTLARLALVAPEPQVLRTFIIGTTHTGAPCTALQQFRQMCVPGAGGGGMNWSTVLRLYLAAHCRPPLNKELWGSIIVGHSITTTTTTTTTGGGPPQASSASSSSLPPLTDTTTNTAAEPQQQQHARHTNQGLSAAENEATVQAFVRNHPLAVAELLESLLAE